MAPCQVEEISSLSFAKILCLGFIKNGFSVIVLVATDASLLAAVRRIDALRHLRLTEKGSNQTWKRPS